MLRATLLLVPLLTGCLAYEEPPEMGGVVEDALPKETKIRTTWAAAAETGEVPDGWLKAFGDPVLDALVGEALKNNLSMRAAAARVKEAGGFAIQSGAGLKPMVGLGVGLGVGPSGPNVGIGIDASWEIDVWGKLTARAEAGAEAFEAVKADVDYARESLAAQVAKTWFLTIEAKLQARLAAEAVGLASKTLDVVTAKKRAGRVTGQERRLARASLRQAQERAKAADVAARSVVRGLELLLGRYPAAELEVADRFVAVPPAIPHGLPSSLLERRWDLVAAERRVRAQFQMVQAATLAQLPSMALSLGGGASSDMQKATGNSGFWSVGANFYQPVYAGGAIEAEVEIQTARQEQALVAYGQTALRAFREVETELENEAALAEREVLLKEARVDYEAALKIARAKYRVGKTELLDVIQIEAKVVGSRSAVVNIHNQRLTQRVNLHMALGGSFIQRQSKPESE